MHMITYVGGDSETLACRSAKHEDVRVAIEFVDHDRMLVLCVLQTGEVMVNFTGITDTDVVGQMYKVGQVRETDDSLVFEHPFENDEPIEAKVLSFTHLSVVPDPGVEE